MIRQIVPLTLAVLVAYGAAGCAQKKDPRLTPPITQSMISSLYENSAPDNAKSTRMPMGTQTVFDEILAEDDLELTRTETKMDSIGEVSKVCAESLVAATDPVKKREWMIKMVSADSAYLALAKTPLGHLADSLRAEELYSESGPSGFDRYHSLEDSLRLSSDELEKAVVVGENEYSLGQYRIQVKNLRHGKIPLTVTNIMVDERIVASDTSYVQAKSPSFREIMDGIDCVYHPMDSDEPFVITFVDEGTWQISKGFVPPGSD